MRTDVARNVHFELHDARGGLLVAQSWEPVGRGIGGVAIVHGLGDHSSRYAHVAQKFAGAGYLVFSHDQAGHGQSGGRRGHVASYSWLLDDIDRLIEQLRARVRTAPVFLYGQSLGGNLVLNYVLRRQSQLSGVIASSPLLLPTSQPPRWKLAMGRLLSVAWPSFTFATGIKASDLSHDPAAVAAYESDPLVHDRVSARLAVQMFAAGRWALAHAPDLAIPTLVLHGTDDAITSCDASSKFAELAGERCTLRTWAGLFHELHWERQREEVISCVIAWMHGAEH